MTPRSALELRATALRAIAPRAAAAVAALALALGGAVLAPAAASAATTDEVTWSVRTASNDYGADRTGYAYTADPGSKLDDALVITNRGDEDLELGVYAADGYTTKAGQFDVRKRGEKSTGLGAWLATRGSVTVPAGQSVEVPFVITVPKTASPGDYAGAIVTSLVQADTAQGINVDRRLGIRMGLRVGGDLTPAMAIEGLSVDWDGGLNPFAGGDSTVSYTLHNTGNAVLSASPTAGVTGPFGWLPTAGGTAKTPPQLLPGETWKVTVPVRDVPATFLLAATASATPIVRDASGSTSPLAPITATAYGAAVPWMLLVIVLVVAALVIAGIRIVPRWRAGVRAREDARVEEAVAAALAAKDADADGPARPEAGEPDEQDGAPARTGSSS